MQFDPVTLDRCAGTLVAMAAGDALGAGYEFATPPVGRAEMRGGGLGPWEPGEWTDDTQMALCIAEEAAIGKIDPTAVADRFLQWFRHGATDVGNQTRAILSEAILPTDLPRLAERWFDVHPNSGAGNGSLMRTTPVALANLGDDHAIAKAARELSALTHGDPLAGDACVLWCVAIDRAIREGRLDGAWDGLPLLAEDHRDQWRLWLDEATTNPPGTFYGNGFVVIALKAALAAVLQTPIPEEHPCDHLEDALHAAVQIGNDTDTVAAIAGALLGARWGSSAVPIAWREILHGWPGYRTSDLIRLGILSARGGESDSAGWPSARSLMRIYRRQAGAALVSALPSDPGVLLGNVTGIDRAIKHGADIVVSLCRMGSRDVPAGIEHVEVWVIDDRDPQRNPNLDFILTDLADSIARWRNKGRTVFVHCVAAQNRTPLAGAAYLIRHGGLTPDRAIAQVTEALPPPILSDHYRDVLRRLSFGLEL